ncbi:MAG: tetratricopeptide repeat protein [Crocosphaera sp.]
MKRLLTASVLGIAGTVGSVLLSTIETPALATLLLAGGVNSLVGILGGVIANDGSVVWDKIGEKLQDNDTILQNNDLKKAVGIAIAAIIAQTAKDENKVNLAYKSHIKKLGKYTVDNWVKLCNEGIISLNEAIFTPIQEHNLSGLMLRKSDEVKFSRVFNTDEIKDKEVWKSLVEIIIENSRILSELKTIEEEKIVIDNIIDSLAEALSNNFLKAFREVLKEDFANGGKAFAGFTMDMFKDLQQGINESNNLILKKLDNLTINDTEEDSQLLTELAKSYNCTVENKKEIKNKLNEEFKQINQKLAALQSNNTEEFRKLGNKIDSEFENIRELLKEIDVKLDELLNITVSIKDETGEILQTVRRLEEQQLISQQNTAPSLLITGDAPKAIANWQGRIKELENIRKWILNPDVNLVGVDGIGGMGKSSLVGKIFADKQDDELNKKVTKRYWADVSNGALFVDVARKVLDKFEGEEKKRDEKQLVDDLLKCLQSGQHLLVLDNLESLLLPNRTFKDSYYQEFFNAWCEFGHQTTIVVTTREKPSLQGMEWINLEGLKVEEGANLLRELGIKGDLAGFSELVGGYPLLLKLVADLLKDEEVGYPEDPDLKRLDSLGLGNLGEILTDERVKGQHRRETVGMVAVLDATTSRLTLQQKAFWCRLSVYQQGFDKVAASFMGEGEVEAELRKLSNRSLLQRSLIGDDYVYQFQPVVKEYALIGLGDATDAHLRAINYYLSILQLHPNNKKTMQPYLETFYHWCQLGDYDTAFDVLREVDRFLTLQGFYGVLVQSYSELVEAFQEENDPHNWKYGASLTDLGVAYDSLGEYQTAIDYHQQSLTISREIGYRQGEGSSLGNLGVAYDSLGEYQTAIDYHQQYLTISREIGDRQGEAKSLGGLGNAYNSLGEYQTAIDYYQQSLTIAEDIGAIYSVASFYYNLGNTYEKLNRKKEAIQSYHYARELYQRIGLGSKIQNCDNQINTLSSSQRLSIWQRIKRILQRFLQWLRSHYSN